MGYRRSLHWAHWKRDLRLHFRSPRTGEISRYYIGDLGPAAKGYYKRQKLKPANALSLKRSSLRTKHILHLLERTLLGNAFKEFGAYCGLCVSPQSLSAVQLQSLSIHNQRGFRLVKLV